MGGGGGGGGGVNTRGKRGADWGRAIEQQMRNSWSSCTVVVSLAPQVRRVEIYFRLKNIHCVRARVYTEYTRARFFFFMYINKSDENKKRFE